MLRQAYFRTIAIGTGTHCNGISQLGRDIRLISEYSLDKWEFIAKEQGRGQCMEY